MENRSLVTIAEHSKEKILYMLEMAKQFEMNPNRRLLQGKGCRQPCSLNLPPVPA